VLAVRPEKLYVVFVAPDMFAQVALSGDDCHWNVIPPSVVYPETLRLNVADEPPNVGLIDAVPAVGTPEQGLTPLPVNGTVTGQPSPPPVKVILPLYAVTLVGVNLTYIGVAVNPGTVNE
jgi:hypothetical protein